MKRFDNSQMDNANAFALYEVINKENTSKKQQVSQ